MKTSEAKISSWVTHLQSHRKSGLTQQAYCQKHALKPHQFWYWKRKLKGHDKASTVARPQPILQRQTSRQGFVPVKLTSSHQTQQHGLTIMLPNGISLSGIDSHNLTLAQQLIGALK